MGRGRSCSAALLRSEQQALDLLVGPHDVGGAAQFLGRVGIGNSDDLHAGGEGRGNAGFGILDDAAASRRHLEQFRRAEEDIRGGLAAAGCPSR